VHCIGGLGQVGCQVESTFLEHKRSRCFHTAGVLVLDRTDPRKVLYRSSDPILAPDTAEEQHGIVDNVVFPTAVDLRPDGEIDVFYGMADARIGVASMRVPETLPTQ